MNIEIYSKDGCPSCVVAEGKASMLKGASYKVYKLGVDFTREELLAKFPTARTFPQITIDGKSIGGAQEFLEMEIV